ncbi:PAS domain S-box protein [Desulfosporosinus sp. BG]|uniref:PAS domain-containing hybrid sensor histidine kinase/response regulator n=1 Tax=Desulfosporosinus sp. BG TaxID=1633135 RepID=UPI00083A7A42|nr:PAS domain S-box protein [Desulfosporosinus sp. BG]
MNTADGLVINNEGNSRVHRPPCDSIYASLFTNNHSIMLLINPETGEIIDANSAACDFYGYRRTDLLNMKISQINILNHEQVLEEMHKAKNENRHMFLFKHKLSNEEIRSVEVYSGPIIIDDTKLLYSIVHNVTDRINAEEEIISLNKKLELKVIERTRQLQAANQQLEELNAGLEEEISERMKIEDSLNKSMVEIRDLYENAPCGYHSLDQNGKILRINDTELKWLGYSREEVLGKEFAEFITPSTKANYVESFKRFLKSQSVNELEFEIKHKDGTFLPVLLSGTTIKDENGRFIMSRSTIYDISHRKIAEDKLKQMNNDLAEVVASRTANLEETNAVLEEEIAERTSIENDLANKNKLMSTLLNNLNVGVSMIEVPSGKVIITNKRAKQLTGRDFPTDASFGSLSNAFPVFKLGTNEPYPYKEMPIIRGMSGESCNVNDLVVVHPDGKKVLLEVFGTPVKDTSGQIVASLMSFADITHRQQAEDEIKSLNNQLVKTNAILEETNAILEEEIQEHCEVEAELVKAKVDAENANIAKSNFLAHMSHEIRTPMTGVMGILQLLQMSQLDEEQFHFIKVCITSSELLLKVINDILDYSKIEDGKLKLEKVTFKLTELISNLEMLFSPAVLNKSIELEMHIESNVPDYLIGDSFKLRQILSNLIGNALKFTHEGRIDLVIRKVADIGFKEIKLEFSVRDTGIGITQDKISELFKSFSQADSSTTRNYGGTGLGLAICKGLTEKMNGEIWVESEVNEGCTFYFTCVLERPEVKKDGPKNEGHNSGNCSEKLLKLLVVEDDEIIRMVIEKFSIRKGWKVVLAEDGKAAIDAYQKQEFNVIIMDCQMPVLDGYKTTAAIRQLEIKVGKHTPIIAMTANALKGVRETCLNAGMDDYLTKPVETSAFYDMVEKWAKN